MSAIQIIAPAKLNLGLRVFPPRADGFHDIESWMVPISLHDTLTIESAGELSLEIRGRGTDIPTDVGKNLITRAAVKLADAAGIVPRARICLHKVIPPGGGLGGGSSDAARTLVALNELWNLNWGAERLEKIAGELGSDVPFFIRQNASLCTGRGEIMTPLEPRHPLFAVLLIAPVGCPTREVYQAFDKLAGDSTVAKTVDWQNLANCTADELNEILVNDLQGAAFEVEPLLAGLQQGASEIAGQKIHLTGSGSTLFTLCGSAAGAGALSQKFSAAMRDRCVCVPVKILSRL